MGTGIADGWRRGGANLCWASGPQRLDVFQLRPQGRLVEKDNRIKSLIWVVEATLFLSPEHRVTSPLVWFGSFGDGGRG